MVEPEPEGSSPFPQLDLAVGPGILSRHLSYSGNDGPNPMPAYDLAITPTVSVAAAVFPAARSSGGLGGNLGIAASFDYAFVSSAYSSDKSMTFQTTAYQFQIGARVRFPVGPAELGAGLDFGMHTFAIEGVSDPNPTAGSVPKTEYKYMRPSVSLRYPVSNSFALLGNLGFRWVLDAGQMVSKTYFDPGATGVWGFDANLGVAIGVMDVLEVKLLGNLCRYGYGMGGEQANDTYVVSGASDLYFGGVAMVAFRR